MAKKKSKPNISQEVLERARSELRGDQSAAAPSKAPTTENAAAAPAPLKAKATVRGGSLATRRLPTKDELDHEYRHITRDLRAMLTLAGGLFLFVIVMAVVVVPNIS
jgi:sulfite reductase alpha subunit-like flavoprotein